MLLISTIVPIFFAILFALHSHVNTIVPAPYMDEIFHIPQAQRIMCNATWQWDEKITTLPGLYLVSQGIGKIVNLFILPASSSNCIATVYFLRSYGAGIICSLQ